MAITHGRLAGRRTARPRGFRVVSTLLRVHPTHPQARQVGRAAAIVQEGGVVVYPTDSSYAVGCRIADREAVARVRTLRRLPRDHLLTLVCRDLSELATYARVDNSSYRIIKRYLPGPYTFVLRGTREAPRRLVHRQRRTIGLRVPAHPVAQALLAALDEPLLSTTLLLPGEDLPVTDVAERRSDLEPAVDVLIDGGPGGLGATTMVDLTGGELAVTRQGIGAL